MSFQAMAWAVGQKLPMKEKFVLLMLANRTNYDTGRCDPSHRRIAEDCGMSPATVKRAIKELVAGGYLSVENRVKNGEKQPNQYKLHLDRVGSHSTYPLQEASEVGSHGTKVGSDRPNLGSEGTEGVGSQGAIKQESSKQEVKQEENLKNLPAATSAAGAVVIPFEAPRVEIPADMPGPKDQGCKTFKTWANYAMAYRKRYSAWPVWNAKVGGQISQLIDRLGIDVAHSVAAFYVTVNDARLINDCHSLNHLLAKCEAFHTQWQTGRQMNGRTARQMEDTQANVNAAQEAARLIMDKEAINAFL
ncbi:helix-turn-helix domain-containing protein [Stutzerimonas stutzeri]|uniref:Helix-turn-helix domain-containing protein n=1 Tax=Stutzerimonas stutzeri TaxID=316 RepID=A0AA42P4J0_STUST|nr:helix-turn-helix domain-containing protein [Stutzerimonas stutzeri]MDH1234456.1 helix-turn-helix domain-containing protein [Stutzerimonas stutzeri]